MKKQLLTTLALALVGLHVNAQIELIQNGTFTNGPTGWTTSGNWYITTTFTCYFNESGYAYAGNSSGQAVSNESGDLKQTQTFIIPSTASSATLTFGASKSTDETSNTTVYDYVNAYLLDGSGNQLMQFTPTNINNLYAGRPVTLCDGYSPKSFSIPNQYFGQPINVDFRVYSDGSNNTMFRIDDVSLTYVAGSSCTSPSASVNSPSGSSPLTMTCSTSGGSGGTIAYKWYSGTTCSGTVLGTSSTLSVTASGNYACEAYITGYESTCSSCAYGTATITSGVCTSPTSSVNSPSGSSPLTMTCTASGGSGGTIAYKWYSGSSCSGTVLGTNSTLSVTASGNYSCKAYINGYESTCYSCATGNATIGSTSSIYGVDVSHYNGTIDWNLVSQAGKSFAYVKATEGVTFNDPQFSTSMTSNRYGVVLGAYHLAVPGSNTATDEANHFLSVAGSYIGPGYLPPALDLEPADIESLSLSVVSTWVQTWMNIVQSAHPGIVPVIYCTHYDAAHYFNSSLNAYGLWIANYPTNPTTAPTNLGIWNTWVFDQYFAPGTAGNDPTTYADPGMDQDVFNGDMTAFNNLINTSPSCTSPAASVNSPSGSGPLTMTCTATGGSGGTVAYNWYSGTSCSGTIIGTSSTLNVTASGDYACEAYITGYESTCNSCAYGTATITSVICTPPTSSVNSPTGSSPLTMICTASGGSGGTIAYKWYSGTSCSGTVIGTGSTLSVTASGDYACEAYINGYESTCNSCAYGYATINTPTCTNWSVSPNTQSVPAIGGSYVDTVFATGTCSYNPTFNDSWLHFVSYPPGDPGAFAYTVDANTTCSPRTGTISVNDVTDAMNNIVTLTVAQDGLTAPTGISALATPSSVCPGDPITLTGDATDATQWSWSGPGGFSSTLQNPSATASSSGTYTLTATNSCGSISTTTAYVTVNPIVTGASASASPITVCTGNLITLLGNAMDATQWSWSGPGGFSSTLQNPSATASSSGTYTLTATNSCGSISTTTAYVTVNPIVTGASASASPITVCTGNLITLLGNATDATQWSWSGPGGFSSTLQNPSATASSSGTYTLTATNSCGSIGTTTAYVTVNPIVTGASASASPITVCTGDLITLLGNAMDATQWSWSGPGGFSSTLQNPSATASSSGTYTLTATNSCGSISTTTAYITVDSLPTTPIINGNTTICSGSNTTLWVPNPCIGCNYNWSNGSSGTRMTDNTASTYTVSATNFCGIAIASATVTISNQPTVTIYASNPGIGCGINTVTLSLSTTGNGYSWTGPGINGSNSNSIAIVSVAGIYNVIVNNAGGCAGQARASITVNQLSAPSVSINPSISNGSGQLNSSVNGGTSPFTYNWSPQTDLSATNVASPNVTGLVGNMTYILIVTDSNGCSASDTITVSSFTGLQDLQSDLNIKIVPNPSSGNFTLSFETYQSEQIQIKIYDLIGQLIQAEEPVKVVGLYTKQITLGNVAKGIYILQIKAGDIMVNRRIEIQ